MIRAQMDRQKRDEDLTRRDRIDTILAREEEMIPSSGFLARVMEKVVEESVGPAPIPFPWKRAIPGFVLAAGVFGWGALEMVRHAASTAAVFALPRIDVAAILSAPMQQAGCVIAALAVSAAGWLLSRRIAGTSSLL